MDGNKSKRDLESSVQESLLPGIPCEITRTLIFPKLSWRELYTLSSVNRTWNYAVRSRQVYDERLRAHSTATFFLGRRSHTAIAFNSMGEKSWYKLPRVPNMHTLIFRIPFLCGCVSMNGRIYVLGGKNLILDGRPIKSSDTESQVFVFDVAAGGKWERCASMNEPRYDFACWTQDGKIYVFGGARDVSTSWLRLVTRPVIGGEVYDPVKNAWSPMKITRSYGGGNEPLEVVEGDLAIYNALEDEWTVVNVPPEEYLLFNSQGKTYSIRRSRRDPFPTQVFVDELVDVHENRWKHSHSFSLNGMLPKNYVIGHLRAILEVEDELLVIASWSFRGSGHFYRQEDSERGNCLLQSRGFGNKNNEISWELRDLNFALNGPYTSFEDAPDKNIQHFILKL